MFPYLSINQHNLPLNYISKAASTSNIEGANEAPEFSLFKYSFLLSADTKRRLMKIEDQERMQNYLMVNRFILGGAPMFKLEITRDNILADAIQEISERNPDELKLPLRVSFIGEEGLDGGGVRKEFFQLLSVDLFDPTYGLFQEIGTSGQLWFSNQQVALRPDALKY